MMTKQEQEDQRVAQRFISGHDVDLTPTQREIVVAMIKAEGKPTFGLLKAKRDEV